MYTLCCFAFGWLAQHGHDVADIVWSHLDPDTRRATNGTSIQFNNIEEEMEASEEGIADAIFVVWIFVVLSWYFCRHSLVVFGAAGVPSHNTWVEFKTRDREDMQNVFLDKSYAHKNVAVATNPADLEAALAQLSWRGGVQSWKNTFTTFFCIPTGSDELCVGDHHVQIDRTRGICPTNRAKSS